MTSDDDKSKSSEDKIKSDDYKMKSSADSAKSHPSGCHRSGVPARPVSFGAGAAQVC